MAFPVSDNFARADGPLAAGQMPSDSPVPYSLTNGQGSPRVLSGQGFIDNGTDGFIVVDTGFKGEDATIDVASNQSAWGMCIYFRVVNAQNWLRWGYRRYTTTSCTAQYDAYGNYIGDSCSTTTRYRVSLDSMTNGSLSTGGLINIGSQAISFRAVVRGNNLAGYYKNATGLITDAEVASGVATLASNYDLSGFTAQRGSMHGIGRRSDCSSYGGHPVLWRVTPDYAGNYAPPVFP